jgi:predicted dehydrogenase
MAAPVAARVEPRQVREEIRHLAGTRHERIRLGVIGLGRLWEARHKPALLRLRDRFQVVSVYDQVARRARIEATSLRCEAADGLTQIIERSDIDAVYLLTPQWFGPHPIRLACEAGKPIYSALPPASEPEAFERIAPILRESGVAFMPELARRFYPASLRLRELLATTLGPPRLVLGHTRLFGFDRYGTPGPSTQLVPAPLAIDPGSYLLDWCRHLFGGEVTRVRGVESSEPSTKVEGGLDYLSATIDFAGGGMAQVGIGRYDRAAWGDATRFLPQPGFQIYAERGAAWLEMPDRIVWTDAHGQHEERLPMEPTVGEILNDQFWRLLRGEPTLAPGLGDALEVIRLDRELRASLREGRPAVVA